MDNAEVAVRLAGTADMASLASCIASLAPISGLDRRSSIQVDLRDLSFCTPAVAVVLRAALQRTIVEELVGDGSRVASPRGECGQYLRRMDVFEGIVNFSAGEEFQRHAPHGFRPAADIFDEASALAASREALRCLKERGAILSDVAERVIFLALGEVAENSVYHATGAPATIMAQCYRSRSGHEVEIAAVDTGPGIPRSLRRNAAYAGLSDRDALRAALREHVTGLADQPRRGLGLWMISEIVLQNAGILEIRSGDTVLRQEGSETRLSEGPTWPGTLVAIRLHLGRPLEVPDRFAEGIELDDDGTIEF